MNGRIFEANGRYGQSFKGRTVAQVAKELAEYELKQKKKEDDKGTPKFRRWFMESGQSEPLGPEPTAPPPFG